MEQIVGSGSDFEQVTGCYAGRIVIVIFGALLRNDQPGGAVVGRGAGGAGEGSANGWTFAAAEETDGGLLRAGEPERSSGRG